MNGATAAAGDFEACNRVLRGNCGAYRIHCDRWWDFRGSISLRSIGSLSFADLRFSDGKIVKNCGDDRSQGDDSFLLILQASGTAAIRQGGYRGQLRPGDCCLLESRYPSVTEIGADFRQYSFFYSGAHIRENFGTHVKLRTQTIDGSSGAGGMLSDLLLSIVRHGDAAYNLNLCHLTLQMLGRTLEIVPAKRPESCDRPVLNVQSIADYIDVRIHDMALCPRSIAQHFTVSLRQLYRIAGAAGYTPAALIWKRRLERARMLLGDRAARISITEVALSSGFKDGAHFSRAYRREFGEAPSDARNRRHPMNGAVFQVDATAGTLSV